MTLDEVGLGDLVERVKAANGPDREIDVALMRYEGWRTDGSHMGEPRWVTPQGRKTAHNPNDGPINRYTASIDAALALVERVLPKGCDLVLKLQTGGSYFHAEIETDEGDELTAYNHPSLPLAILAAALSALSPNKGEGQ